MLSSTIERLDRAAARYSALLAATPSLSGERRRPLDAALMAVERMLTLEAGLPERPWFRHQIYAPGFYTGYGVKTLPGVREAIEQRQWERARTQMATLAQTIERSAEQIEKAVVLAQ